MKLNLPAVGLLSIDFKYIRIPHIVYIGHDDGPLVAHKRTCQLKTICDLAVGETKYRTWVWQLENPVKFDEPIAAKGSLGFWDFQYESKQGGTV
jgi:hypothetical protein